MINENTNPKVKILVGYHKPATLIKNEIFTPIHLGRDLATQASKDGEMSQEDFDWMCENMIGDNTGENISSMNRYLNELTGLYWAWKNYDELGNPDYIGFIHYRRFFITKHSESLFAKNSDNWSFIVENAEECKKNFFKIERRLSSFDIVIPKKFFFNKTVDGYKYNSCKDFLLSWNGNKSLAYNLLVLLLKKNNMFDMFLKSTIGNSYYPCNMFIMKKEIFFDYCVFMFDLINEICDVIQEDILKRKDLWQKREIAWVSEYITNLFIYMNMINDKKIKEYNVAVLVENKGYYGAADRVKNQLAYKIGSAILSSRTFFKIIKLPFELAKIYCNHKNEKIIYEKMVKIDNSLKLPLLEQYVDYSEAEKIKNHLSYRIGYVIIKHPFSFIFRVFKIYKEWKNERKKIQ
ncbi:DUF4422 domain-containing protein [Campylobacter lari]|nr:DUF4422 domain-containing protein [Campylobacter lari]